MIKTKSKIELTKKLEASYKIQKLKQSCNASSVSKPPQRYEKKQRQSCLFFFCKKNQKTDEKERNNLEGVIFIKKG